MDPSALSFQNFNSGSASAAGGGPTSGTGTIGSSMLKPGTIGRGGGGGGGGGTTGFESEPQRAGGGGSFWSITYYQPLFDVDTLQVLQRIKGSLLPRPKGAFFEQITANPDLYGPFWISTTLVFVMAMTGNLASYVNFVPTPAKKEWTYDFSLLTLAGTVVYLYWTLLPMLFWMLLRYWEASKKLVDVLCIYGYALSPFIPISILCVVPSNLLRWLLVLLGGAVSLIFLLSNFHAHLADCFPYGEGDAKRKMYVMLGTMAAFHAVLLMLFKFYFFSLPG